MRTQVIPKVVSSVSLWYLESSSELLFVGDADNTEAGPATQRYGIEWATYWNPSPWLQFDSELSLAQAEFRDQTDGKYVENAVPIALSAGITAGRETCLYGALRARYLSKQPLTSDKSVESRDSLVFNLRTGYRKNNWEDYAELLNLFDTDANDIEYYCESQLPGERDPVENIHLRPMEPRSIRTGVIIHW